MSKQSKATFDPKKFLAIVGDGKTIAKYQKDQIVFSQGDVADAVFLHPERQAQALGDFPTEKGKP